MWIPVKTLSQETQLHWKNGDSLPGKLIDSKSGKIFWSSPYFLDDLIIDKKVLESIVFSEETEIASETFRVSTILGDVWIADIIGADENSIIFSSKRFGEFRVNRKVIYSLENREHTNLIFDGSQLKAWKPSDKNRPRFPNDTIITDWYPDRGGHPYTDESKANIFREIKWPTRFEIDLELASTTRPPGFVFALGKNLYEELRVETWVNELVVVQGTLFESLMKIDTDRRNFRLRLSYDQELGKLKVFDLNGNLLLELNNVKSPLQGSGPYIYNRGSDLTVKRLRIYRQPNENNKHQVDYSKARIHMMNGDIFYGKLYVENNKGYVFDTDGIHRDIDLKQIDRVVNPGRELIETEGVMALTYIDGSVVRGSVVKLTPDSVILQTSFVEEQLLCSLSGASLLRLESKTEMKTPGEDYDKMFFPYGSLRGRVLFGKDDLSNIRWQSDGMSVPVRLANDGSSRIERNSKSVSRLQSFDVKAFPHLLHLQNGEVIPCQVESYDGTAIHFRSPFISAKSIDSKHIKGIEFTRGKIHGRKENRNPITIAGGDKHRIILEDGRILEAMMRRGDDGNLHITVDGGEHKLDGNVIVIRGGFAGNDAVALKHGVERMFDPLEIQSEKLDEKLKRALTVPRFNRENPPNHILVANNGDLMRGKLLNYNGETILFESKLKKVTIPIDRVARVVDISLDNTDQSTKNGIDVENPDIKQNPILKKDGQDVDMAQSEVRFALIHNPILIFEPLEVKGEILQGRSPLYGNVSVPVKSIQYLHFGDKAKSFQSVFKEWFIRPATEPAYGEDR